MHLEAAALGPQLEDVDCRRVVDEDRCGRQALDALLQSVPLLVGELAGAHLLRVHLRLHRQQALDELHVRHLEREDRHALLEVHRGVARDREDEGGIVGHGAVAQQKAAIAVYRKAVVVADTIGLEGEARIGPVLNTVPGLGLFARYSDWYFVDVAIESNAPRGRLVTD